MTRNLNEQYPDHRRDILKILLSITIVAGSIYSFINFTRGVWLLGGLEFSYVCLSVWIFRIIGKTTHLTQWIVAYLLPLLCLITYAIYLPSTSDTLFSWILITPVVLYLLLGSKLGLWFSVIFVTINIIVYQLRFFTGEWTSLGNAGIYNILISSIALTTFAHLYERNREITEARLMALAGTDQLTGLPNRMRLLDDFNYVRAGIERTKSSLAVAMIDLDHFKLINDNHGHDTGDQALLHTADLIRNNTREVDLMARLGGEEFTLVMPDASAEDAKTIVDRLRETFMATPMHTEEGPITITFSAGIAEYWVDGRDLETLIRNADRRLYHAKNHGRNQVVARD